MPYTIVFSARNTEDLSGAEATPALEALATIDALQSCGDEIKYVMSPQEREIGVECFGS
jgi:hypothetical protein